MKYHFMEEITGTRIATSPEGMELGEYMSVGKTQLHKCCSLEQIEHQTEKAILVSLTFQGAANNEGYEPVVKKSIWLPKSKIFLCAGFVYVHEYFFQTKMFSQSKKALGGYYHP